MDIAANRFSEAKFTAYALAFQEVAILDLSEVLSLVPALKLVLLERIASRSRAVLAGSSLQPNDLETCVKSLRDVVQTSWNELLEPLIMFDRVLRRDPAQAYAAMDLESRALYREKLAKIASRSDMSEMEVANETLALAQFANSRAYDNPRAKLRDSHVGYYIMAEGTGALHRKVGFKPDLGQRVRSLLRRHPDEFFLPGIAILTLAIVTAILVILTSTSNSPVLVLLSLLVLLLPSSQAAVQVMNYLITSLLAAEILPKLDFSEAIPDRLRDVGRGSHPPTE